jgi:hypothetical protein
MPHRDAREWNTPGLWFDTECPAAGAHAQNDACFREFFSILLT